MFQARQAIHRARLTSARLMTRRPAIAALFLRARRNAQPVRRCKVTEHAYKALASHRPATARQAIHRRQVVIRDRPIHLMTPVHWAQHPAHLMDLVQGHLTHHRARLSGHPVWQIARRVRQCKVTAPA